MNIVFAFGMFVSLIVFIIYLIKALKKKKSDQEAYKQYKKMFLIALIVNIVCLVGGGLTTPAVTTETPKETAKAVKTAVPTKAAETATPESKKDIVEAVQAAIAGEVGKNETITNVTFDNRVLTITVDLSKADTNGIPKDTLAITRVGGITDKILELDDYYDDWDKIVIDFGDIGKVTLDKSMVVDEKGIGKYFTGYDENSLVK